MKSSVIKTIYLYLATLFGMLLLSMGLIQLFSLGLRTYVFTQADREYTSDFRQPPVPINTLESLESDTFDQEDLSQDDIQTLQRAVEFYREQERRRSEVDPLTARRHRELSISLSMILVGLPLYLYHWSIVRRGKIS